MNNSNVSIVLFFAEIFVD